MRSQEQIRELFNGFRVLDPGVVPIRAWRPEPADDDPTDLAASSQEIGVVQPVVLRGCRSLVGKVDHHDVIRRAAPGDEVPAVAVMHGDRTESAFRPTQEPPNRHLTGWWGAVTIPWKAPMG